MIEPLVLESFVAAVACLCASSYGPNNKPNANLRENIATALSDWDRNVLQIFLNSNRKFSFNDNADSECELPDADMLDERLYNLEFETNKQKQQTSQLTAEIKRLSVHCKEPEQKVVLGEADTVALMKMKAELQNIKKLVKTFELRAKSKDEEIKELNQQHEKDQNELKTLREDLKKLKAQTKNPKNVCLETREHGLRKTEICRKEYIFCAKSLPANLGDGWILVAQRFDGSQHFYFDWRNFVEGCGRHGANFEFFVGLERLHMLTRDGATELLFIFKDIYNQTRYAHYDRFIVGDAAQNYELRSLGAYAGDAGDSLNYHLKQKFSTFDKDNESKCAEKHTGGWWYKNGDCHRSNLFGVYRTMRPKNDLHKLNGMIWSTLHNTDNGDLVSMRMYIRP